MVTGKQLYSLYHFILQQKLSLGKITLGAKSISSPNIQDWPNWPK